jgi:6-phosphofructokinase
MLKKKYFKEKGIMFNTEVIKSCLIKQLGKTLAQARLGSVSKMVVEARENKTIDVHVEEKIEKAYIKQIMDTERSREDKIKVRTLRMRENQFNKNYNKVE